MQNTIKATLTFITKYGHEMITEAEVNLDTGMIIKFDPLEFIDDYQEECFFDVLGEMNIEINGEDFEVFDKDDNGILFVNIENRLSA